MQLYLLKQLITITNKLNTNYKGVKFTIEVQKEILYLTYLIDKHYKLIASVYFV